ncbi:MAG: glycosyltransferase family 2 protein [Bacteroidota bacterium]
MDVSVIIPVLNEEKHIEDLLSSIYNTNDCNIEIFVCDAGSTDHTLSILNNLKFPNLNIIYNPEKFVSFAFNNVFTRTKGKYIALLGAHAYYPPHYFDYAIPYLETECDVVGGPLIQLGKTTSGKAIALAMSSKFGVGGTEFRTEKKKMVVDSVAFAVYKRDIFDTVGLLDETLLRNQDDELHYRMNAYGYKLLMVPELECRYYVRDSFAALFHQYFQYGLYKPLVFAKVKSGIRLRHIIPSLFVGYLCCVPFLWILLGAMSLLPLAFYVTLAILMALQLSRSLFTLLNIVAAFVTLHLSYGSGFILGLYKYFQYQFNQK